LKPFDSNGAFQFNPTEVRRRAIVGAGSTLLSAVSALGIQVISTIVLARLLSPSDFGLIAMVSTFSALLVNWGPNGFTEAVLQADEINHALASNLFWINVGTSFLLAAMFAASGSLLALFYGDHRVVGVAVGMSVPILVNCLAVQHIALLKRAMCFPVVSANDVVARFVSVAVAILLGCAGWGYWALVAGATALPLSTSIGAWFLCRWVPGLPRRRVGTARMVRFALHTYGRFSANYFANNTDNLLVGWRFGASSLGFYKKAYDLFSLPMAMSTAPLTNVAVSALSRLRGDLAKYTRYLLRAAALVAFVGMALSADLTLVGKDVIRLLLGPGWEPAGYMMNFFGPGIGIMLLYYMHGWIHLSIGRADRWFRWGMIEAGITFLLFIVGLPWGPVGVAVAWTVSFFLLTGPAFWYAGRPIQLGFGPVLAVVWRYMAAAVLAGGASAGIARGTFLSAPAPTAMAAFLRIVITSLLFVLLYLAAVIVLHQTYAPIYQVVSVVKEMCPPGMFSKPTSDAVVPYVGDPKAVPTSD